MWGGERSKPNKDSSAPLINNLSFDCEERFDSAKKLVSFKTLPERKVTSYKKVHRIRSKVSFFLTEKIVGHSFIQIRNSCFFSAKRKKKYKLIFFLHEKFIGHSFGILMNSYFFNKSWLFFFLPILCVFMCFFSLEKFTCHSFIKFWSLKKQTARKKTAFSFIYTLFIKNTQKRSYLGK